jgi:hypothetical protein
VTSRGREALRAYYEEARDVGTIFRVPTLLPLWSVQVAKRRHLRRFRKYSPSILRDIQGCWTIENLYTLDDQECLFFRKDALFTYFLVGSIDTAKAYFKRES